MRSIRARAALSLFFCLLTFQLAVAQHMKTGEARLAPFGFTRFCVQEPERCTPSRAHVVQMNVALWSELNAVNASVNRSIVPEEDGSITRAWRADARRGDCKDYALSKRSRLIDLGWSASALLLAIAELPTGEMHAVLIVVTDRGDLVLDNLRYGIVDFGRLPYRWTIRMSPGDPRYWQQILSRLRVTPEPFVFPMCLRSRLRREL